MPVDDTLLQNARRGGRAAFDRLQRSTEPRVRRFIHRLIGTSDAAESIAQDAFLALWVKIAGIAAIAEAIREAITSVR